MLLLIINLLNFYNWDRNDAVSENRKSEHWVRRGKCELVVILFVQMQSTRFQLQCGWVQWNMEQLRKTARAELGKQNTNMNRAPSSSLFYKISNVGVSEKFQCISHFYFERKRENELWLVVRNDTEKNLTIFLRLSVSEWMTSSKERGKKIACGSCVCAISSVCYSIPLFILLCLCSCSLASFMISYRMYNVVSLSVI